jgi:hypothetical protein
VKTLCGWARARRRWIRKQDLLGPASSVFIDESRDMQSREAQRRERARELLKRREVSPRM